MTQQYRKVSELSNWDKNPRGIKKEDFERLKKQIQKLGQYKPLLINKEGVVLGGNMRLRAYKDLGIEKVWVHEVDADTEQKMTEYALSDNDRAGYYEDDALAELIASVPEINLDDYKVDLGQPITIGELLRQFSPEEIEEDEAPELEEGEPDSKLGEVYQLGRHRLMCGDATKIEDVEKLMDGQKADMVFTDPPYGIDLDTDYESITKNWGQGSGLQDKHFTKSGNYSKVIGDDKPFSFKDYEWLDCKEQFWWGANYYIKELPDGGAWFIWDKTAGKTQETIGSEFEMCWSKQKHKQQMLIKKWAGAMGLSNQDTKSRVHPTQKPIEIHLPILEQYSKQGDIVLDLFGGSGSTLIACEQTDRTCYMMEIDPRYCDVIRKRYENFITAK